MLSSRCCLFRRDTWISLLHQIISINESMLARIVFIELDEEIDEACF